MATSQIRGHKIMFLGQWVYVDNKAPITVERPCIRCGKMPTPEGFDACLGYIPGVKSACCGHGIEKAYFLYREKVMPTEDTEEAK
jgi:hypothetical protein